MSGTIEGAAKAVATNRAKYGKVSPSEAGKLGGRPRKQPLFLEDTSDFGDGFFAPTWKQRMLNKIRSK